jgi:hypothetical protein
MVKTFVSLRTCINPVSYIFLVVVLFLFLAMCLAARGKKNRAAMLKGTII